MQLSCKYLDILAFLIYTCGHILTSSIIGQVVTHTVVGVVLDILGSYAQFGIGLLITEHTLNATAFFSVEIVIPPDVLRVIGGLQEYRVALLIES